MKKILSIALALTMVLSLAACGGKEEAKSPIENDIKTEETQKPVDEVTKEEPEKIEGEIIIEEKEDETVNEPIDEEKTEEETEKVEEPIEEITKGIITLSEDSELNTSAEFSGLYKINGYSKMNFLGKLDFQANMEGVDFENNGEVDLSKAKLPDTILKYNDYTYFSLTFTNNEIVDWDVIDRNTKESILSLSDEELLNYYFPEVNFEIIDAGELPETINLSNYEVGKTYAFTVSSEENFSVPSIINDTDIPLLIASVKTSIDEVFEREYKSKYFAPNKHFGSTYSDDGKYYVAIIESNFEELMNSDDCLLLEGYNIDDELDFDFENFVGNNTNKTITIVVNDWDVTTEITLAPGEVAEVSWMNDVTIKDIQES